MPRARGRGMPELCTAMTRFAFDLPRSATRSRSDAMRIEPMISRKSVATGLALGDHQDGAVADVAFSLVDDHVWEMTR